MSMAAQRSPTDTNASHNLGFVPHADLAQFNTGPEYSCQILYQFPEIDSSIRRKIEQHLVIVKGILRIDQLHFQSMLLNLLQTDVKSFLFFQLIGSLLLLIPLIGNAQHRL